MPSGNRLREGRSSVSKEEEAYAFCACARSRPSAPNERDVDGEDAPAGRAGICAATLDSFARVAAVIRFLRVRVLQ